MNTSKSAKRAFEKALQNLPNKLNKIWESESGKSFIRHLLISFLPHTKKEVYPIGIFTNHKKYNNIPKVCCLTNFAVTDVDFTIDEVTLEYFRKANKNITRVSFAIPCVGSTRSKNILSKDALLAFHTWAYKHNDESLKSLIKMQQTENKKVKKVIKELPEKRATYSLADTFDFQKLKK